MLLDKSHLQRSPKQLVETSIQGFSKEYCVMLFQSGEVVHGFAITPIHFKQIYESMAETIKQFEAAHGTIIIVKDQPVISPIQMDDLSGPKQDL